MASASQTQALETVEVVHHPELETALPSLENFAVGRLILLVHMRDDGDE